MGASLEMYKPLQTPFHPLFSFLPSSPPDRGSTVGILLCGCGVCLRSHLPAPSLQKPVGWGLTAAAVATMGNSDLEVTPCT